MDSERVAPEVEWVWRCCRCQRDFEVVWICDEDGEGRRCCLRWQR